MSSYAQGQHAISRSPKGRHAIERYPLGRHGVARPCSYYIRREVGKRSMPALGILLSASVGAGSLSIPIRAIAEESGKAAPVTQTMQIAPEDAVLVIDERTGLLVDIATGKMYDPLTRFLVDAQPDVLDSPLAPAADAPEAATPSVPAEEPVTSAPIQTLAPEDSAATDAANEAADVVDVDAVVEPEPPSVSPEDATPSQPVEEPVAPSVEAPQSVPIDEYAAAEAASAPAASADYASVVDDGTTVDATVTELQVAVRLLNAGWTPEMVAAALGNMYAESGSNAASYCDMSGMFNYAHELAGGLFQWTDAGASPSDLSCSGFTALRDYAAQRGVEWTDPALQAEYFLQTWRSEWTDRSTYYDAAHPDFADVDVSLGFFDECMGDDFDGDGIIDAWDDDIDGDGIPNAEDLVIMRVVDGEVVYGKSAGVSRVLPLPATTLDPEQARRHVEELTFAFMAGYEGPAANVAHFDRRAAHALRVYPAILALDKTRELGIMDKRAGMVVAGAEAMLGGTYVWGAESPSSKTFDCSGLTKWCYSLAGVGLEHYSESQYLQADDVHDVAQAVPGDILWRPGHVGIYIGNGRSVEAKGVNYGIVYGDASSFMAALHFEELDQPLQ